MGQVLAGKPLESRADVDALGVKLILEFLYLAFEGVDLSLSGIHGRESGYDVAKRIFSYPARWFQGESTQRA